MLSNAIFCIACVVFAVDLFVSCASVGNVDVQKRSDVDLKTCIDNFAIHKDKIIRTQDSRAMGAKYLNEIDLDTREECLRLCCETENCDVFIYEEKSVGSCYLFQCGPPEVFKCKFTHHVNYSSGVLTVNRHLPDLESQIKLTKHEDDLSKLRKPDVPAPENNPSPPEVIRTTVSTTTTTAKSKDTLDAKSPSGKCKRFQFECRSNSECIAIYNACDGIPQCSDGSDEAPELGCPAETSTVTSSATNHLNSNVPSTKTDEGEVSRITQPANVQSHEPYHPSIQNHNPQLTNVPSQEDFIRPSLPDQRNVLLNSNAQLDPPQMAQFPQYPAQSPNWPQHQSSQLLPQSPQYDKNSHIFNHKGSGLQVPDALESRYNKYKGAMQTLHRALGYSNGGPLQYGEINTHEYQKIPPYYGEVYRQPIQQIQDNWPHNPPSAGLFSEGSYRNNPYGSEPNSPETWHRNILPSVHNEQPAPAKAEQEFTQTWKSEEKNPTHVQNKLAHELKQHSKEQLESKKPTTKQIKIAKHTSPVDDQSKYVVAERLEIKEGLAEAPGGAILSLTLGFIIMCLMGILIACRLRVVRRRMRRGGKSYAHDADYLVNGMYL